MTPATNGARADRYGNPGWSIQPGSDARSVRQILTARGAVRWYTGSAVSLIWILTVVPLLTQHGAAAAILPLVLLVVFAVGFLVGAPLAWSSRGARRLLPAGALFALSFSLFPWIGWEVRGLWTYVGVLVAMAVVSVRLTWLLLSVPSPGSGA